MKGFYAKNFSSVELQAIYFQMLKQCNDIKWIENAFKIAWFDFTKNKFQYDGATFVQENKGEFWEVASFIHDWLNIMGYVGKQIDLFFIKIMIQLDYPENIIFERCKWMQWTWINKLRHKVKRTFKADNIPPTLKIY